MSIIRPLRLARTQLWAAPPPSASTTWLDVESGLDRQDHALGDAEVRAGQDDLVDGLDRLTGTDRSDVGDRPAHRRQDRARALDISRFATDEDRQRRVLGAFAATRDRSVDHRQVVVGQALGEVPASRRRDRRAVDDEGPRAGTADDAVRAEQDRLDVRRVRDADDGDADIGDGSRRRLGDRDAQTCEVRGAAGRPVPAGDREAGAGQVGRHRRAHGAETEEGDPAALW